jgi:hypothetical protein
LSGAGLLATHDAFGPVALHIPSALKAAKEFRVNPKLVVGVMLIEGQLRQYDEYLAETMEDYQVLRQDNPSIGIMQMKYSTFIETTFKHPDAFSEQFAAGSAEAWKRSFRDALQDEQTALRYAAAHLSDIVSRMRTRDRKDLSLVAATYNAGIESYRQDYLRAGRFGSPADTYRVTFQTNMPFVNDLFV